MTIRDDPLRILRSSTFGQRTAEEEKDQLKRYFVETEQWSRVFSGDIDIVYGAKGSGKSAIYSLILENQNVLFDRNIIVAPAENPQGAPAFQTLSSDTPQSEFEFVSLWKLYFLSICARQIREFGFTDPGANKLIRYLEDADLIPAEFSLGRTLKYALDYVKSLARRVSSVEHKVELDLSTGMPIGFTGKISLGEPTASQSKAGIVSLDEMFRTANQALSDTKYTLWILLDRLDVAFVDKPTLETEALRALFKCYLDIKGLEGIRLKIFLRSDIWSQITQQGFREASHIERSLTISWKEDDLLNLVVRRLLSNDPICEIYDTDKQEILSDFKKQQDFFYKVFPRQVDSGPNKPSTLKWLLGRTRDAAASAAPREVIHFLNELRDVQITRFERGVQPSLEERLFEQVSFKDALPAVSQTRLHQTLFAEYPAQKMYVEKLRQQKAQQNVASLANVWGVSGDKAIEVAKKLEEIGFFERVGSPSPSPEWRVPFLYRPALELVQGSADT